MRYLLLIVTVRSRHLPKFCAIKQWLWTYSTAPPKCKLPLSCKTIKRVSSREMNDASLEMSVSSLEMSVSSLEMSVSSLKTSVSSLEMSVSSLEMSVSSLKTSVSSLKTSVSSLETSTVSHLVRKENNEVSSWLHLTRQIHRAIEELLTIWETIC